MFVSQLKSENAWIKLKLQGDGKKVNRSAIGAIARITVGEKTLTRQVEAGTGEGNQNDLALHFGIGEFKGEKVNVEVTWPGNSKQKFSDLKVNSVHLLIKK